MKNLKIHFSVEPSNEGYIKVIIVVENIIKDVFRGDFDLFKSGDIVTGLKEFYIQDITQLYKIDNFINYIIEKYKNFKASFYELEKEALIRYQNRIIEIV